MIGIFLAITATFNWQPVAEAEKYKLYTGAAPGVYTDFYEVAGNSFTLEIAESDLPKFFAVSAVSGARESVKSSEIVIKKKTGAPGWFASDCRGVEARLDRALRDIKTLRRRNRELEKRCKK